MRFAKALLFVLAVCTSVTAQINNGGVLVAPGGSTLGGVKTVDCTATPGHILKLDNTGTFTCSPDGGGGSTTLTTTSFIYPGFNVQYTSTTKLTFNAEASAGTPAGRAVGDHPYAYGASFAPVISAGTGTEYFYLRASDGAFSCGDNGITTTCPGGQVVHSITAVPQDGSVPLWSCTAAVAGQWDNNGCTDIGRWVSSTQFIKATANGGAVVTNNSDGSASVGVDNTVVVFNNQANTYTAGSKQTVQANATNAGLNFAGVTADPSSLANGDVWHRSDLNQLFGRLGGATLRFAFSTGALTNTHCAQWNASGNLTDSGNVCGGTGTVTTVSTAVLNQGATQFSVANPTTTPAISRVDAQLNTWDQNYPGVALPGTRMSRYIFNNGSTGFNSVGDGATESGTTTAQAIAVGNTTPPMTGETTGTVSGNTAGVTGQTKRRTGRTNGMIAQAGTQNVTSATNVRYFIGLSDQTLATMLAGNVPSGNYVGVEFDSNTGTYTGLTDTTHFVCVVKNNTTQVATSTGNNGDTAFHKWAFVEASTTSWRIYMDGVQVCGTQSSNVPLTNTNIGWVNGVATLTTSGMQVGTSYLYVSEQF